jgi:hypothetical protein
MLKLDNLNVPLNGRAWVVPPVEKKSLLGIDRFTEQSFTGEMGDGNSIRNGMIGDLYGTPVYVTTTVPTVTADDTVTDYRAAVYIHKGAITHAEQLGIRTQSDYKLEYLGDLFVADTIYGVAMLRDDSAVSVMVPA